MVDSVSGPGEPVRRLIQGSPRQVDDKTFARLQEAIEEDLQVDEGEREALIDGLTRNKFKRSQIPQVAAYISESLRPPGQPAPASLSPQSPLGLKARLEGMGVALIPLDGGLHWSKEELAAAIDVLSRFPPSLVQGLTLAMAEPGKEEADPARDTLTLSHPQPAAGPGAPFRQAFLQGVARLVAAHLSPEQRMDFASAAFRDLRDRKEENPQEFESGYRHLMGAAPPPVLLTPPRQIEQDPTGFQAQTQILIQNVLADAIENPQALERYPRLVKVVRPLLAQ